MGEGDYAIAADSGRFVSPGFSLSDLVTFSKGYQIDGFFRTWKYIKDEEVIRRLLFLLNGAADTSANYISEIHRFEAYFLNQSSDRLSSFTWEDAGRLMREHGIV